MSLGQDGPPTRTRLPESTGSGTGASGRRPTRSPGRSLITVVGVVVLLIAVIAFAGRGGVKDSGGGSATGSGSGSGSAEAQATAPTGTKPVSAKDSAGIASGFARTAQGAQSAAANYAVALGGTGMYTATTRHAIINAVYAPASVAAQLRRTDQTYSDAAFLQRIGLNSDGTAPNNTTFISRVIPAGTKLKELNGDTATVAVWYSSLFGLAGDGSTNPVSEAWYTITYRLAWASGDWKITSATQANGPAPVARDQRASSAKEMSDAVNGFGGFTYAR